MQKLYFNGTVLTMNEDHLYDEALLIEDGKILAVGALKDVETQVKPGCERVDLDGKCIMPSFIDPHSHITQYAVTLRLVQLGGCKSVRELQDRIEAYIRDKKVPEGAYVCGVGYDQNFLAEQRHITCKELDEVSPKNPVIIAHISMHLGVMNSLALADYQLDGSLPDPEGGTYERFENGELNGLLTETAFMRATGPLQRCAYEEVLSHEGVEEYLEKAQNIYASYGITMAQEGAAAKGEMEVLERMSKEGKLKLDIVAYVDILKAGEIVTQRPELSSYHNHFRIGGYKIFLDGSPQAKTAWMSEPYEDSGDYCGKGVWPDELVNRCVQKALDEHRQILCHTNGDAASQQMLNAFHQSRQKTTDTRPVMVHCQTLRRDQMQQLVDIGMLATFFVAHVYHWGDIHYKNFGPVRGNNISATASALRKGISFTFHQDTPVLPPNMIETLWIATNRITKNGRVLGAHQRITMFEALKAITINAAYQYFEEDSKGTLDVGKLADLVILSEDLMPLNGDDILKVQVLETIKEGNTIYKK